jgi:hypothetical protein
LTGAVFDAAIIGGEPAARLRAGESTMRER